MTSLVRVDSVFYSYGEICENVFLNTKLELLKTTKDVLEHWPVRRCVVRCGAVKDRGDAHVWVQVAKQGGGYI